MTASGRRLVLVLFLAGLWCAAVGARLVYLQVVRHDHYAELAAQQQRFEIKLDSPRGSIYDARGRVLAVSVPVFSVYADPRRVDDPAELARELARVVPGLDVRRLGRELASDRRYVSVARKLDPPVGQAALAIDRPGVYFVEESKRYYPMRELASQVLGFVGTDHQGLAGLEQVYDRVVAGQEVRRTVLRDARQVTASSPDLSFSDVAPGRDLHLTIDASIQHAVEEELARGVEAHGAKGGTAVLLDPVTGAILALASYPSFDPNRFADYDARRFRNPAIQEAYEPGSTLKMVTAAAALESNRVDPSDVFDCGLGSVTVAGTLIRDHKPFGYLTFRDIIARSSNVGAIKIGLRVGPQRLYATLRALGFGAETGVDLPGESAGLLRPVDRWWPVTTAYISFGQGISVTPLQLASAFAAVANGGVRLRPYVVAGVGDSGLRRTPQVLGRPISESTARELERMFEEVVADGTGQRAAIPGYTVAGKTGTAQKAVAGGGYSASRFVASFVGFVPARHPAFVGLVVVDEPRDSIHGGTVAAPIFAAIGRRVLPYLGIPVERDGPPAWPASVLLAQTPPAAPASAATGGGG